jgi:hypothetical protein
MSGSNLAEPAVLFDGRHSKVPVVQEILDWLANAELPPKLVFHAGTPKTCLALESRASYAVASEHRREREESSVRVRG